MKLKEIDHKGVFSKNKPLADASAKLQDIIKALNKRILPEIITLELNKELEILNTFDGPEKKMLLLIKTTESKILQLVRNKLGLVPEKYYTFLWMPLGMATFGAPLGTFIFAVTGNPAFIGIGLPIGMALGTFLGMALDNKAKRENKVLLIE